MGFLVPESIQKLFEALSEGIIIFEKSDAILWCNSKAAQILSTSKETLMNSNLALYFPELFWDSTALEATTMLQDDSSKANVIALQEHSPKISAVIFTGHHLNKLKKPKFTFEQIIGQNEQLLEIIHKAKKAAASSSHVLIYGETGTGKELFAQSIHSASSRADKPFTAINCAAIPETLLEGILFGTTQGAFTGAVNRPGLFEQASEGTLFLDELNSTPLPLQAKLLRVLQEGSLRRVGGTKDIPVNPRIISCINVEPFEAIEKELLRSDLFYRLGVVCLPMLPLRQRKDDLPLLVNYFVTKISQKLGRKALAIAPDVLEVLTQYDWPGNVRQLEHAIECAINLTDDDSEILLDYFPEYLRFVSSEPLQPIQQANKALPLKDEVAKTERSKLITTLEETKGNINQAAKLLGISRQSLYYRMKKFKIAVNRDR